MVGVNAGRASGGTYSGGATGIAGNTSSSVSGAGPVVLGPNGCPTSSWEAADGQRCTDPTLVCDGSSPCVSVGSIVSHSVLLCSGSFWSYEAAERFCQCRDVERKPASCAGAGGVDDGAGGAGGTPSGGAGGD